MKVWCVKHRDGWCAAKRNEKWDENNFSMEVKCGRFVVLPLGCERREPDCYECRAILADPARV